MDLSHTDHSRMLTRDEDTGDVWARALQPELGECHLVRRGDGKQAEAIRGMASRGVTTA